ncbi:MAG: tripartite tricarboxylate transporter substrate binding protein, partial [Betaproteobacteria bacterium]|nr:tripartite tricarboxylate transporter substrate binding protein [Betaproteobacteria bacterium]
QISFPATTSALPLIQAGKLRPLAVTTARRTSFLPSVPTVEETGLGKFDRSSWYGLMAPAGTPKAVIARLNDAVKKALNTPEVKRSFQEQGIDAAGNSPEQFASFIRSELEVNAAIVKSARIKAE